MAADAYASSGSVLDDALRGSAVRLRVALAAADAAVRDARDGGGARADSDDESPLAAARAAAAGDALRVACETFASDAVDAAGLSCRLRALHGLDAADAAASDRIVYAMRAVRAVRGDGKLLEGARLVAIKTAAATIAGALRDARDGDEDLVQVALDAGVEQLLRALAAAAESCEEPLVQLLAELRFPPRETLACVLLALQPLRDGDTRLLQLAALLPHPHCAALLMRHHMPPAAWGAALWERVVLTAPADVRAAVVAAAPPHLDAVLGLPLLAEYLLSHDSDEEAPDAAFVERLLCDAPALPPGLVECFLAAEWRALGRWRAGAGAPRAARSPFTLLLTHGAAGALRAGLAAGALLRCWVRATDAGGRAVPLELLRRVARGLDMVVTRQLLLLLPAHVSLPEEAKMDIVRLCAALCAAADGHPELLPTAMRAVGALGPLAAPDGEFACHLARAMRPPTSAGAAAALRRTLATGHAWAAAGTGGQQQQQQQPSLPLVLPPLGAEAPEEWRTAAAAPPSAWSCFWPAYMADGGGGGGGVPWEDRPGAPGGLLPGRLRAGLFTLSQSPPGIHARAAAADVHDALTAGPAANVVAAAAATLHTGLATGLAAAAFGPAGWVAVRIARLLFIAARPDDVAALRDAVAAAVLTAARAVPGRRRVGDEAVWGLVADCFGVRDRGGRPPPAPPAPLPMVAVELHVALCAAAAAALPPAGGPLRREPSAGEFLSHVGALVRGPLFDTRTLRAAGWDRLAVEWLEALGGHIGEAAELGTIGALELLTALRERDLLDTGVGVDAIARCARGGPAAAEEVDAGHGARITAMACALRRR